MLSRRSFLRAAGAFTGLASGLGFYTWRIEPGWVELVHRTLPIRRLPPRLQGSRLVHVSDIHVGLRVQDDYLLATLERVRALQPDIVVVTGDLMSWHERVFDQLDAVYRRVPRGRLATVATLGNHDYGPEWGRPDVASRLIEIVQQHGMTVLRNQVLDVEGLQIVGLDDLWAKQFNLSAALGQFDADRAGLALSHNPDTVDQPGWDRYEGWILAGHTHGGQCKPPFLPPPVLPVKNRRYTSGEFRLAGNRRLYINRGIGHVMSVRFNVRPEITVCELCSI